MNTIYEHIKSASVESLKVAQRQIESELVRRSDWLERDVFYVGHEYEPKQTFHDLDAALLQFSAIIREDVANAESRKSALEYCMPREACTFKWTIKKVDPSPKPETVEEAAS